MYFIQMFKTNKDLCSQRILTASLTLVVLYSGVLADVRSGNLAHGFLPNNPREADFSELTDDSVYSEFVSLPVVEEDFVFNYTYDSVHAPYGMMEIETPDTDANVDSLVENGGVNPIDESYATTLPVAEEFDEGRSFKIRTAEGDTAYLFFTGSYIGAIDRFHYKWVYQFEPVVGVKRNFKTPFKQKRAGKLFLNPAGIGERGTVEIFSPEGRLIYRGAGDEVEERRLQDKFLLIRYPE